MPGDLGAEPAGAHLEALADVVVDVGPRDGGPRLQPQVDLEAPPAGIGRGDVAISPVAGLWSHAPAAGQGAGAEAGEGAGEGAKRSEAMLNRPGIRILFDSVTIMVRPSNESQAQRFRPRRRPSGTANFGNLLRDPTLVMQGLVAEELARRGFADLRPALLAVGQHVGSTGSRVTELAERAWLTKATVVRAVDELERLGYVTRRPDPTDGRAKLVMPTARALAAERAAREAIAELRADWAALVGEPEMAALEDGLRRLRAALWPEV